MNARVLLCACAFSLLGCGTMPKRVITGALIQPASRVPIGGQKLDLDRPPGNYAGNPVVFFGWVPQPVAIARATTDRNGRFRFETTKDRGRSLELRLAGESPADFRSPRGYAVRNLADSLSPSSPSVRFHGSVARQPDGGFRAVPAAR